MKQHHIVEALSDDFLGPNDHHFNQWLSLKNLTIENKSNVLGGTFSYNKSLVNFVNLNDSHEQLTGLSFIVFNELLLKTALIFF